ncbi:MAG TPA: hypothetical protein VLY24_22885 [Bryobacteraceae bacterium]|nr:hypothetical protein [Bryobacteraceae bacterium]
MSLRFLTILLLAAAIGTLPLAGQSSAKHWVQGKTVDGQPDLQGVWINATITPFERPNELAGKPVLTDQEAAALEEKAAEGRVDKPPKEGDVGSYNQVWFDSGTKVVSTKQTALVVDPADGRVPVRPEAEARREFNLAHNADSYEYMSLWDRCITRGVPGAMFPAGYNNAYQIVQIPGYVVLESEMIHNTRIIPIDGRPHVSAAIHLWDGDSRGHWEGNTLVVDTTNYNNRSQISTSAAGGRIKGITPSEKLHVVERFTRISADTIHYEVTIDDPATFTRPWKISIPLSRDAKYQIYEYACQEGNYAMTDILNAGRVQDASAKGSR